MALRKPTTRHGWPTKIVRVDPDGIHALTEHGQATRPRRELTRQRHDLASGLVQTARGRRAPDQPPDCREAHRDARRRTGGSRGATTAERATDQCAATSASGSSTRTATRPRSLPSGPASYGVPNASRRPTRSRPPNAAGPAPRTRSRWIAGSNVEQPSSNEPSRPRLTTRQPPRNATRPNGTWTSFSTGRGPRTRPQRQHLHRKSNQEKVVQRGPERIPKPTPRANVTMAVRSGQVRGIVDWAGVSSVAGSVWKIELIRRCTAGARETPGRRVPPS
jgi:hypothetical protein